MILSNLLLVLCMLVRPAQPAVFGAVMNMDEPIDHTNPLLDTTTAATQGGRAHMCSGSCLRDLLGKNLLSDTDTDTH